LEINQGHPNQRLRLMWIMLGFLHNRCFGRFL